MEMICLVPVENMLLTDKRPRFENAQERMESGCLASGSIAWCMCGDVSWMESSRCKWFRKVIA